MMYDYRPKSVNEHHKMVIKCWFGGTKKDFICICVCIAVCQGIGLQETDNWQGDKLQPGVNTARTLYISNYFVTNISSNLCPSSFSPSICSDIASTVVDYGHFSHHLIICQGLCHAKYQFHKCNHH